MPASWRPSRGAGYDLDEIRELAGVDRMTIPAPLLEKLESCTDPLPQILNVEDAKKTALDEVGAGMMTEKQFRYMLNMVGFTDPFLFVMIYLIISYLFYAIFFPKDGCGNDKLAEGIRAFVGETEKLEDAITDKVREAL